MSYLIAHYLRRFIRPGSCNVSDTCYLCHAVTDELAPKLWPVYIAAAWLLFDYAILHK